jgi:hypothetical protein
MTDVKVYYHYGEAARIGPLGAWEVGDNVTVPALPGKFGGPDRPEFEGVVTLVGADGMANVGLRPADETL